MLYFLAKTFSRWAAKQQAAKRARRYFAYRSASAELYHLYRDAAFLDAFDAGDPCARKRLGRLYRAIEDYHQFKFGF